MLPYAETAPTKVAVFGEGGEAGVCGISEQGVGVAGASRPLSGKAPGWAGGFEGNVVIRGNLIVTGVKNAAVPRTGGKHQLLYCVESPESWLEDFGEARLVNGRARIRIDRDLGSTIDTRAYHVFVSAYGPEPVFVSKRSRNGFEIRAVPREGCADAEVVALQLPDRGPATFRQGTAVAAGPVAVGIGVRAGA